MYYFVFYFHLSIDGRLYVYCPILFILVYSVLSGLFCSILFCSNSIKFYLFSLLFCSILFYSVLCYVLFYIFVLLYSAVDFILCSVL